MSDIWLIADPHFGHKGAACEFEDKDGKKIRPFSSVEEQDETLVANWNRVVGDKDRVYVLGDLAMKRQAIATVGRCKGRKVLIKGNHDIHKLGEYLPFFDDIRAFHKLDNFVLTHIPVHVDCLKRESWGGGNIHGHLHEKRVLWPIDWENPHASRIIDPKYLCVSVEQIAFTPISFENAKARLIKQQLPYWNRA